MTKKIEGLNLKHLPFAGMGFKVESWYNSILGAG
jgi:hypothetical protein